VQRKPTPRPAGEPVVVVLEWPEGTRACDPFVLSNADLFVTSAERAAELRIDAEVLAAAVTDAVGWVCIARLSAGDLPWRRVQDVPPHENVVAPAAFAHPQLRSLIERIDAVARRTAA
jgi:hypothetical protein